MREDKKGGKERNGNGQKEQKEALQNELLADAFNACMEEQLSFIPSEREIARMHEFSDEFKASMEHLCRTSGKLKKREMSGHEFVFSFHKIAACLLLMLLIGGICVGGYLITERGYTGNKTAGTAETTELADTAETVDTAENTGTEEAVETAGAEESEETEQQLSGEIEFAGSLVQAAPEQNLPSGTEEVRTLVSSPVLDRDAQTVKVTIGNLGEKMISYSKEIELQVYLDGVWYTVPRAEEDSAALGENTGESGENTTESKKADAVPGGEKQVELEAGMAQDEELQLSAYRLDYEAEKYRAVICVDGRFFGSEFRFETLEEGLEEALEGNLNEQQEEQ